MVYVLILLGLAVVIAPLVSVMPSKSQRAKAALRDEARGLSFRVSLRPLPAVPARFRLQVDTELACYERRLPGSLPSPKRAECFVCIEGAWWPTQGAGNAPGWLAELPEGAVYVERVEQAISIFWDEKMGSDGLSMLCQAIEKMINVPRLSAAQVSDVDLTGP